MYFHLSSGLSGPAHKGILIGRRWCIYLCKFIFCMGTHKTHFIYFFSKWEELSVFAMNLWHCEDYLWGQMIHKIYWLMSEKLMHEPSFIYEVHLRYNKQQLKKKTCWGQSAQGWNCSGSITSWGVQRDTKGQPHGFLLFLPKSCPTLRCKCR